MFEVALDSSSGIKVEVCRICEFVWFDAGETQTLQARPLPKPKPQVVLPQEAREAIALAKVQQLAEQARGSDFDSAPPDEWWKSIAAFFGMPVEFDAPAKKSRPAVTWFLAGLIVTASVHAFFHLQEAVQLFGLIPAQAFRLHGLTFVTSFFLHAGIIHLVGNMYFLLVFGDDVENFLGPLRYIALIAIAAFVGDLCAHCIGPEFHHSLYRCQRRNRRCDHILRFGISAGENRLFVALLLLFSLDSPASVVRFRALDSFPNHRRLRTKDRN